MTRRRQRLTAAAAVVRTGGRYDGWCIGRIVYCASDAIGELRRISPDAPNDEVEATSLWLRELERFDRALEIARIAAVLEMPAADADLRAAGRGSVR